MKNKKTNRILLSAWVLLFASFIVIVLVELFVTDKLTWKGTILNVCIGVLASSIVSLAIEASHSKDEKKQQRNAILMNHEIISGCIEKYTAALAQLISKEKSQEEILGCQFQIKDMGNMCSPSAMIGDIGLTIIESFLEKENALRGLFTDFLVNQDLSYYEDIKKNLIGFVNSSEKQKTPLFINWADDVIDSECMQDSLIQLIKSNNQNTQLCHFQGVDIKSRPKDLYERILSEKQCLKSYLELVTDLE